MANRCLRKVGVEPVDEVGAGRNSEDLRELVNHSARAGALDEERRDQLVTAMELDSAPLRELVRSELAGDIADQALGINAKAVWFQLGVVDQDAYARTTAAGLDMVMDHCPAIEWGRLGPG